MKRFVILLSAVALLLAASAAPVSARLLPIALTGTGSATVEACGDATPPPCEETVIVSVALEVGGSLLDEVKGVKDAWVLTGSLEIPVASLDPNSGCYTATLGNLQLGVPRGSQVVRQAFALVVSGSFCPGSFIGTFAVDASDAEIALFRGSVGTGVILLQHALDVSAAGSSPASMDMSGSMETRR